jgi:hypothetical protein
MQDRKLQQLIKPIIATLDELIELLEGLDAPEVTRVKVWKSTLTRGPSVTEINEVWHEMQHIGTHMGYMDYSAPIYNAIVDRLLGQMEEIIAVARRQS